MSKGKGKTSFLDLLKSKIRKGYPKERRDPEGLKEKKAEVDIRFLHSFNSFTDTFKEEFLKSASAYNISRRDIFDTFNQLEKAAAIEKFRDNADKSRKV